MIDESIELGCTFTPEKYPDQESVEAGLKFVLDVLKLREIRFSVRWNKILQADGSLNLNYYKPFFAIFSHYPDLRLCLNLGPLKTTDWPEVHVPEDLLQKYSPIPVWPQEISRNHSLIREAGEYLHRLCKLLRTQLPTSVLKSITTIQLDNEGYNPFGEKLLTSSIDVELYFESIAATYFANKPVLFNSAGKLQVAKILKTQAKLPARSILGIDYYYHTPTNDYYLIRNFNQLNLPLPWAPSMRKVITILEKTGNTLEFTEVQMEKWGHITYPGESKEALIKTISKLSRYKPAHQETLLLRLWGVELLACSFVKKEQTPGMEDLADFIAKHA